MTEASPSVREPPPGRERRLRVAAIVFGLGVALAVGEIGVRIWGQETRLFVSVLGTTEADLPVHRASSDPELLYEMRPGFDAILDLDAALLSREEAAIADRPRRIRTNALGFRDVERAVEKPAGVVRIVCLGGSNTYGAAVTQGNPWPAQLEEVLRERGHDGVEVWNLGVDGYESRQKLRLASIAIERYDADVLIFQLYNRGPRVFLRDTAADLPVLDPAALPEDGGIYRENLQLFPGPGLLMPLARRSALLRVSVIAAERLLRWAAAEPGAVPPRLDLRAERRTVVGFAHLAREADTRATLVLFVPPVGGRPPLEELRLPLIDLEGVRWPDLPDIATIHPGAAVYRWYAEQIADRLVAGGCLDPDRRCTGLPTTDAPPAPEVHRE